LSKPVKAAFFFFMFLLATTSFANNPGISYQGRIFKPDGNPLEGTTVQFRMQVRSPGSENCLLYEEVQTLNMAGSAGVFALTLNDGTGTRLDAATYQVDRIFANRDTMTLDATRCTAGTTYTPNSADGRKLVVYFKDETMTAYEAMPLMNLNYVPQAMYALEAQKVDKFAVSNILRAVDGSGNPVAAPALNPTQLVNLNTLLATPAANYVQTTTNGSAALPVVAGNPSSGLAAGQIWYDSGSNVMKYYDGAVKTFGTSGGGVTSVATGTGLTGGPITTTGTINVDVGVTTGKIVQVAASNKLPVIDGSNLTNITATDATKLPLAGGTMTGPLVNNSNSASTALAVTQAGAGYAASFMGGNVGIGTASPAQTLDVNGNVNISSFLQVGGVNFTAVGGAGTAFWVGDLSGAGYSTNFYTNGTEKMRITSTGNVGIGTTTPASQLTVSNTADAVLLIQADSDNTGGDNGTENAILRFAIDGGTAGWDIADINNSGTSRLDFMNGGSTFLALHSNGNVGVGTTTPGAQLDITASANTVALQSTGYSLTGANASSLMNLTGVWDTSGTPTLIKANVTNTASGASSLLLDLQVGGASKFRVSKNGSLISSGGATFNTDSNAFAGLEIYNTNAGAGAIAGARFTNDNYAPGFIGVPSSAHTYADQLFLEGTGMVFNSNGTTKIKFRTNSNDRMLIDSNGNVGIGTTSPSTKLHVVGSSGATIATFADGGATTCTVTPASTGFACSSDERLKKNIETFSDSASLENILQLRTVTYDWRSVDNGRHTGYIAQELEEVAPEFVRTGEDGFKQVNYTGLVPWITGAIKAFYGEFKASIGAVNYKAVVLESKTLALESKTYALEAKNTAILQENAELKARLDQQEKELAVIKNKLGL
jgi:hypothetical protein